MNVFIIMTLCNVGAATCVAAGTKTKKRTRISQTPTVAISAQEVLKHRCFLNIEATVERQRSDCRKQLQKT